MPYLNTSYSHSGMFSRSMATNSIFLQRRPVYRKVIATRGTSFEISEEARQPYQEKKMDNYRVPSLTHRKCYKRAFQA